MVQLVILAALSVVMIGMANGLCMPEHIQTQFCNADYGKACSILYYISLYVLYVKNVVLTTGIHISSCHCETPVAQLPVPSQIMVYTVSPFKDMGYLFL